MFAKNGAGGGAADFDDDDLDLDVMDDELTHEQPAAAAAAREPVVTRLDNVEIEGTFILTEDGEMQIEGSVTGNIKCRMLTVGTSGCMRGDVEAERVDINGEFNGRIKTQNLVVAGSARVSTDEALVLDSFAIEPAARFIGTLRRPSEDDGKSGDVGEALRARRKSANRASPEPQAAAE
jgi:cytoskeletal protein CcmA (bactofilin family)